jgi:EpsI family protein
MTPEWVKLLVPVFLGGQGLLVYWSASTEHPPAPPLLAQFPLAFSRWTQSSDVPIDADVAHTLRADRLLSRTYSTRTGDSVEFLVAWFQSQRAGASQPHSPKVCLPASGWATGSTGDLTLATSAGPITVNRYVVSSRDGRATVLYWYQTSRRAIAGEWASKFWLVADAVRDRRTDTALARIVVEEPPGGDRAALETASDFARSVYPLLRERLPR